MFQNFFYPPDLKIAIAGRRKDTENYEKALQELAEKKVKFDIVFLDPPYKTDYAEKAIEIIIEIEEIIGDIN